MPRKGEQSELNLGGEPTTLNPLNSTDQYAQDTQAYIMESLAVHRDDTYEWEPALASSWTASKDGKEFTFKIRPGVTAAMMDSLSTALMTLNLVLI